MTPQLRRGDTLACALVACALAAGCQARIAMEPIDAGSLEAIADAAVDAPLGAADAGPLDAGAVPIPPSGLAPEGALSDEVEGLDGEQTIVLEPGLAQVFRIEAEPTDHVTFFLSYAETLADVELEVLRWDGEAVARLGVTDAGRGLRTLAAFDPEGPRTFWARVTSYDAEPLSATLRITRVHFEDGVRCASDCAHLLQLPLPNDPMRDGYLVVDGITVFRYQYGRRDLVMFVRYAAQRMASLGYAPFVPQDLSQWNGETPGTDTGSLRHVSHQRGKDVDLSLYGTDGLSMWRHYCTFENRECVSGTIRDYDNLANAILFGAFFESHRVTMSFLDRELIPASTEGARSASDMGLLDPALVPFYSDGRHLQHWPNHANHIHVRVSESTTTNAFLPMWELEAFEPP